MNGVKKDSFLKIVKDKQAGGLIFDALSEIHNVVLTRPAECDKKYLKRWHGYVVVGVILSFLLGYGYLTLPDLIELIR